MNPPLARISECPRRVEDNDVVLTHPSTGLEVRIREWEARILPFLDDVADIGEITRRAARDGVRMPVEHVRALIERLADAGMSMASLAPAEPQGATEVALPRENPLIADPGRRALQAELRRIRHVVEPAPHSDSPRTWVEDERRPEPVVIPPRVAPPPASAAPPAAEPGPPIQAAPIQDKGPRRNRAAIIGGVVAVAVAGIARLPVSYAVVEPCVLRGITQAYARAQVTGRLKSAAVDEGSEVAMGDLIAVVDGADALTSLAQLEAELQTARDEVLALQRGKRADVARAKALLGARGAVLRSAQVNLERLQEKYERDEVTISTVEDGEIAIAAAKKSLTDAQERLVDLMAESLPEAKRAREAQAQALQSEAAHLRDRVKRLEVRSPIVGTVVSSGLGDRTGSMVSAGDILAEVVDLRRMRVEARVAEEDAALVWPGIPVSVDVPGFSKPLETKLTVVSPSVEFDAMGKRYIRAEAEVGNPGRALRRDVAGQLRIDGGRRPMGQVAAAVVKKWWRAHTGSF